MVSSGTFTAYLYVRHICMLIVYFNNNSKIYLAENSGSSLSMIQVHLNVE